ncbi:aminodeoxychorismate lyase [Corynebacterium ciconiae]|uniref:aminodeoxychorismate lyase n=1 Tax=Corynebacterium ciconiae TaxID=227319 RepID=UPI000367F1AA|nr:aminodeoxychorismate lyase [Corynebacterium ciconiae]
MTPRPIIVTLDLRTGEIADHDPETPLVYWDDSAVTRGDGVFETVLVRQGRACNLQRHVERFAVSAQLMHLPPPAEELWARAISRAARRWEDAHHCDGAMVWTYTRGRASTGEPSAWISVKAVGAQQLAQRAQGVAVLTLERGADSSSPRAAKTLSYASAMAALRQAAAQGMDDVIYTSGDRVLEGATSTVVAVSGSTIRTPKPGGEILPGTTQAALFSYATAQGYTCETGDISVSELLAADSVWLVSSVRIAAQVTSINGHSTRGRGTDNAAAIQEMITAALM